MPMQIPGCFASFAFDHRLLAIHAFGSHGLWQFTHIDTESLQAHFGFDFQSRIRALTPHNAQVITNPQPNHSLIVIVLFRPAESFADSRADPGAQVARTRELLDAVSFR